MEINEDEDFEVSAGELVGRLHQRPSTEFSLAMPVDVLASLTRVAEARDMPVEALVRFYVGKGLREDLAKGYADRLMQSAAQVLTRHLNSEEEVSAILREIREETVTYGVYLQDKP
jgi:hypothetical protein